MYACLSVPSSEPPAPGAARLVDVARSCSPRVSQLTPHLVVLDVDGLTRLFGTYQAVAEQLVRSAVEGGYPQATVAVAATQTAVILLALARPGIIIVDVGREADALAPMPVRLLEVLQGRGTWDVGRGGTEGTRDKGQGRPPIPNPQSPIPSLSRWGIRTLGQLAALPTVALSERLGQTAVTWQRWARGEDLEPLVPTMDDDSFDATFEPEWPIEGMEALGAVLDLLLEPLCRRLERRDRAAAVLHVRLRLVTRDVHARSLQLPAPMRDPATLRTLILLALEAHPAPAGIDVVTLLVDPTPGRVVQESLLTRAVPPPEQVSTLMARLGALMGERRCGSPALVDSYRPGMFAMQGFSMEGGDKGQGTRGKGQESGARGSGLGTRGTSTVFPQSPTPNPQSPICSVALRRFRLPISARVEVERGRPVTVRTDRQNLQGGAVRMCAGPWRTTGEWWKSPGTPPTELDKLRGRAGWNRDEWDVALHDGGIYRLFVDRDTGRWFVDGILD